MSIKKQLLLYFILAISHVAFADDGYRLWLKYDKINNLPVAEKYKKQIQQFFISGNSATIEKATKEFTVAIQGLLSKTPSIVKSLSTDGTIIAGTTSSNALLGALDPKELKNAGDEAYYITTMVVNKKSCTLICGNTDIGVL